MSTRHMSARLLLAVLMLLQALAISLPVALLLAADGATSLPALAAQFSAGHAFKALAVALLASVLLGSAASLALWRLRYWGAAAGLLLSPALLPIGLLARGDSVESLAILFAGHASLGLALGTACGMLSLIGVDGGVLRAAACCGVSPWAAIQRVLLRPMLPGVVAGTLLTAVASVAISVSGLLQGRPAVFAALTHLGTPLWLASAGVAVLLCAVTSLALVLLRRG